LIHEETNLVDTYKISNQLLADCLRGVCLALTTTRAAMGLPFSDLCALAQEHHGVTAFATAEAGGANPAVEAGEKLLKHPLVQDGRMLPQAGTILVSIVGGPDLTIADVNRVMAQVQKQSQGAPVVMGAGIHPAAKEKLFVVLLLTGAGGTIKTEDKQDGTAQPMPVAVSRGGAPELEKQFLGNEPAGHASSRFIPPPPVLSPEQREQLIAQHAAAARQRKGGPRLRQTQLPLEIVSKGRFDKSEPTIYKGEDLDVPTYIRRGIPLN
jgi:cell division protein FtsZ